MSLLSGEIPPGQFPPPDPFNLDSEHNKDALLRLIHTHIIQLNEQFDTVHIFCTRHKKSLVHGAVTTAYDHGAGNWYTRLGQIMEWVSRGKTDSDSSL